MGVNNFPNYKLGETSALVSREAQSLYTIMNFSITTVGPRRLKQEKESLSNNALCTAD